MNVNPPLNWRAFVHETSFVKSLSVCRRCRFVATVHAGKSHRSLEVKQLQARPTDTHRCGEDDPITGGKFQNGQQRHKTVGVVEIAWSEQTRKGRQAPAPVTICVMPMTQDFKPWCRGNPPGWDRAPRQKKARRRSTGVSRTEKWPRRPAPPKSALKRSPAEGRPQAAVTSRHTDHRPVSGVSGSKCRAFGGPAGFCGKSSPASMRAFEGNSD